MTHNKKNTTTYHQLKSQRCPDGRVSWAHRVECMLCGCGGTLVRVNHKIFLFVKAIKTVVADYSFRRILLVIKS